MDQFLESNSGSFLKTARSFPMTGVFCRIWSAADVGYVALVDMAVIITVMSFLIRVGYLYDLRWCLKLEK